MSNNEEAKNRKKNFLAAVEALKDECAVDVRFKPIPVLRIALCAFPGQPVTDINGPFIKRLQTLQEEHGCVLKVRPYAKIVKRRKGKRK